MDFTKSLEKNVEKRRLSKPLTAGSAREARDLAINRDIERAIRKHGPALANLDVSGPSTST